MSFDCFPSILVPCLMASEALGMSSMWMFCQERSAGIWPRPFVCTDTSAAELSGSNRNQEAENDDYLSTAHAC